MTVSVLKLIALITPADAPPTVIVWPTAKPKSLHESTPVRVIVLALKVKLPVAVYSSGA